ncbi:MAG: mechanosensitive ion channel domain-containing protein [Candidatus Nanopelagicales bacterium]
MIYATVVTVEWFENDVFDGPFGTALRVGIIVLSALIVQGIARIVFKIVAKRAMRRIDDPDPTDILVSGRDRRGRARRALAGATLVRSAVSIAIWTVAAFLILEALGVNLGPILASAGVLGIILGFGAQTLVADYLAGASMIFSNQIGVGDVVQTDVVQGVVEEVALRTTTIRDFSGSIWYIRNGQMQYLVNQSQGATAAVVDIPVAFNADLHRIAEVLNAAGAQMMSDPELSEALLEPPTFSGVQDLTGNAVLVRVVATIRPATQLATTRILRMRFKEALDAAGISIPWQRVEIENITGQ